MAITNAELLEWLEEQATWIKDAAVVYYNKGQFSQSDIERFADECMSDIAKMSPAIDVSGLDLLGRDESQNYSLLSVGNIVGVNALAPDRKLSFAGFGQRSDGGRRSAEAAGCGNLRHAALLLRGRRQPGYACGSGLSEGRANRKQCGFFRRDRRQGK